MKVVEVGVQPFEEAKLAEFEGQVANNALSIDRNYRSVLEQNLRLAEEIEPAEAEGIADLNELRMLIGLPPVLIDVKLCTAARGHSADMKRLNFFSHTSKVPGKKTPWNRAKLAGTTASAENIYVGSRSGKSANKGWWYSPGHHKNMLSPGQRRIGLGNASKHWTQMFGR